MKFPPIRQRTSGTDHPQLKREDTGDVIPATKVLLEQTKALTNDVKKNAGGKSA